MHRVALLDDHPAVLAGLRRLIDAEPDLAVVAAAPTAREVEQQLHGIGTDVLVADYDLGRSDGLAHCLRAKRRSQAPAIVIYSAYWGPALILAARAAGADAIVDKAEPVGRLLSAIRGVAAGRRLLPAVPRAAFEAAVLRLDDEDLAVFAMLLDGASSSAIAQARRRPRQLPRHAGRTRSRSIGERSGSSAASVRRAARIWWTLADGGSGANASRLSLDGESRWDDHDRIGGAALQTRCRR